MKTKLIILVAFAGLITMSSCNFVHHGPRYRHLNKIPASISVSNPYEQSIANKILDQKDSLTIAAIEDTLQQTSAIQIASNMNDTTVQPAEPQRYLPSNPSESVMTTLISSVTVKLPSFRKHSNLCSAPKSKTDDGLIRVVLIGAIIVASFAVLGGIIVGIDGVMVALFFFIPLFLLALAIHYMVRYDKKKKGTDHASTFVSEGQAPEPSQRRTRTRKEKTDDNRKPFPWGILGVVLLLAILIPMIGGILLLAALAIAVLAGGVALGLFVYNKLSGKK